MMSGRTGMILLTAFVAMVKVAAAQGTVSVSHAWTPPAAMAANTPLFMTVTNAGAADLLLRARCTVANFTEQHALDHGEGFPSMRTVKSIPIVANGATEFNPDGYHVMLLQTTRALAADETFHCDLTFRDAGKRDVAVTVGSPE